MNKTLSRRVDTVMWWLIAAVPAIVVGVYVLIIVAWVRFLV